MAGYESGASGAFLRVGVVGCGRVGRTICEAIDAGVVHAELAAVSDVNASRAQSLVFELKRPTRSMSLTGLVASCDLVVEATNRHIAAMIMMAALDGGRDLLVTNAAAIFARSDFAWLAHDRGLTIHVANVLLTGDTALSMAAASKGASAALTITCPVPVLADAPFLRGRQLSIGDEPQLVFQGAAGDAMAAFPGVSNLIAAAAIGAGGADLLVRVRAHTEAEVTDVELVASVDEQRATGAARVRAAGSEPVAPEVIGLVAVSVLRRLTSSLRLAG